MEKHYVVFLGTRAFTPTNGPAIWVTCFLVSPGIVPRTLLSFNLTPDIRLTAEARFNHAQGTFSLSPNHLSGDHDV